MAREQQPLELILARNLMSSISTPSFLVDTDGIVVFYNEAAGVLLGKRFEETGRLHPEEWGAMFGPFDDGGQPIDFERLPLTVALREGRPAHARLCIHSLAGDDREIEVSAMPLVSTEGGFRGALAIFWPLREEAESGGRA